MKKLNILAFSAHPDDLEVTCAGTLAKYNSLGNKVFIAIACNGNAGHTQIGPVELEKIRRNEANQAASIIDAELIWLGIDDHFLMDTRETRLKFLEAIRYSNADIILTCPPNDYCSDHRMVGKLAYCMSTACCLTNLKTRSKELSNMPIVYYFDTLNGLDFAPEEYVDITDFFNIKIKMLSEHKTQLEQMKIIFGTDLIEIMKNNSINRGQQCGVKYAEAFKTVNSYFMKRPQRLLP